MNPGYRAQDQINTNEPTAPYVEAECLIFERDGWTPRPFVPAANDLNTELPRPLGSSVI